MKRKPTGFIAKCQCGSVVGAMDFERTDRKDASRFLSEWLLSGCTVEPQFGGEWTAHIRPCTCDQGSAPSATEYDLPAGGQRR